MKVISETVGEPVVEPFLDEDEDLPKGTQTQIAGTERTEIPELSQLDEKRRAIASERVALQGKEREIKDEMWALLLDHQEQLHVRTVGDEVVEYVYRYTDAAGKTRDVIWSHKEVDKLRFETAEA